jgi:hypothetical protein
MQSIFPKETFVKFVNKLQAVLSSYKLVARTYLKNYDHVERLFGTTCRCNGLKNHVSGVVKTVLDHDLIVWVLSDVFSSYNSEVNQLKLWGINKRIAPCFGLRFQR